MWRLLDILVSSVVVQMIQRINQACMVNRECQTRKVGILSRKPSQQESIHVEHDSNRQT